MPTSLSIPNHEALTLPDKITPYDNFELPPPPDANWLLSQVEDVATGPIGRKGRASQRDINLQEDYDNSQFLTGSNNIDDEAMAPMDDLGLVFDFGIPLDDEPSSLVEAGRDAPMARSIEDDMLSEVDVSLRQKEGVEGETSLELHLGDDGVGIVDTEGDIDMGGNDFNFNPADQSIMREMTAPHRDRISESPLSDIDPDVAREVEAEYSMFHQTDLYEPEDGAEHAIARRPAQRAKKQKILTPDDEIALSSSHIKRQQQNRDNIIKATTFLPRDPFLLALMDMQKSGGFVSSIMMEGRSSTWAPELRGMLSLDAVRGLNELKRKRDSGIADVESDHGASKSPRLDIGDETEFGGDFAIPANQSMVAGGTILDIPADDGMMPGDEEHRDREMGSPVPGIDEPLVPLAETSLVSVGTKHAVHILRDVFGAEAATSPNKRKNTSVIFQELLPEKRTTKAEATKMFFECLVLATKDAIKVEQGPKMGDNIRIRGKQGLWGDWAEREAGGEISQESDEPEPAAVAAPPTVAVSA